MKKRKAFRAAVFVVCAVVMLAAAADVLRPKFREAGTSVLADLETAESYPDVLFLGSSHIYADLSAALIYETTGIASYLLSSAGQPIQCVPHLLEDQLERHRPQVVLVDVFTALWPREKISMPRELQSIGNLNHTVQALEGIRSPVRRMKAFVKWFGYEEGLKRLVGFPVYHTRYGELTQNDWRSEPTRWKGEQNGFKPMHRAQETLKDEGRPHELPQETYDAIDQIIQLCQENGTELVFMMLPVAGLPDMKATTHQISAYIEGQGVRFINADRPEIYQEMDLDFAADFADTHHMNLSGQKKCSAWVAAYLKKNYELQDRRKEPGYESWEEAVIWEKTAEISAELQKAETLNQRTLALCKAKDQGVLSQFSVAMNVMPGAASPDTINNGVRQNLEKLGMHPDVMYKGGCLVLQDGEVFWQQSGFGGYGVWDDGVSVIGEMQEGKSEIFVGNHHLTHQGDMGMMVYDKNAQNVVCEGQFYMK